MRPSDLQHVVVPADPQLHPDGRRVAYVRTGIDLEEDRYVRSIHLVDGEEDRPFTAGPADSSPRWSPDGSRLAFLRKGTAEGAKAQVMVMPTNGGEPVVRTDLPLGASDLVWSPDGTRLVVVGAEYLDELADLDDEERKRRPKRITRLPYRADGEGWLYHRRTHLWLVDPTGEDDPRCLTPGDEDESGPSWRPDGQAVAYLTRPEDRDETDPSNVVMEVDLASGERRRLVRPGMWASVDHAPDGQVFVTGLPDVFDWPAPQAIHRVADGVPVPVTGHLDLSSLPNAPACVTVGPRFVDGGFVTALEDRGTTRLVRVSLDAPDHEPTVTDLVAGQRCVTGFAVRADGSAAVVTVTDAATPGELVWVEDAVERPLSAFGKAFRSEVEVLPTERSTFERDGQDLDVWAVLPAGFAAAEAGTVPVILNIHGGPTSQYGEYFFDEFQVAAGAGYLAVATNPRGSSGRGRDFARAIVGAWDDEGSVDTLDLEAVVDAVVARYPQADADRVAVMGGSYGGYATARLLARTDRYGSAIVERGLLQWESFSGTSDIGPFFDRMFLAASLPEGVDVHRAASPVASAPRITTPTLVLHSEADWRCPIEQAEQFFVALKRAGVPTEMVRFPDEGHELSRSGKPKHRVERFEIVLEWHDRWLRRAE